MLSVGNVHLQPMTQAMSFKSAKIAKKVVETATRPEAIAKVAATLATATAGTILAMQNGKAQTQKTDIDAIKAKIKNLQDDLKYQMAHPPQTRDPHDWGYYEIYMNRLQDKIADLRKICPLDKTNLEECLAAAPQELFVEKEADNIKGQGISFLQQLPENPEQLKKETYRVVPMLTHARTVEDLINIGKRDGINIELVKDANGEYFLGVKDVWSNNYHRINRDGAVIKYGPQPIDWTSVDAEWAEKNSFMHTDNNGNIIPHVMDCAVIANAEGLKILDKSYIHENGEEIQKYDMYRWSGFNAHKSPTATVNAVAWGSPRKVETLEGQIETDATMGDVEGYAYNNFAGLVKQISKGKLKANPAEPNSIEFCKLVKEGKLEDAKTLLIEATKA